MSSSILENVCRILARTCEGIHEFLIFLVDLGMWSSEVVNLGFMAMIMMW